MRKRNKWRMELVKRNGNESRRGRGRGYWVAISLEEENGTCSCKISLTGMVIFEFMVLKFI